MKTFYTRLLLLLALLSTATTSWAEEATQYDFEIEDEYQGAFQFKINSDSKTVSLCGYDRKIIAGEIKIPNTVSYNNIEYTVTDITDKAFYANSYYTYKIFIPKSIKVVGKDAFGGNVSYGISIEDVGAWCRIEFEGTHPLRCIYEDKGSHYRRNDSYLIVSENLVIPDGITEIKPYTFYNCNSVKSVMFSNSVTSIGDFAFANCNYLESIEISNSVTSVGTWAFRKCTNLKEVHISDLAAWCNINFSYADSNPLTIANHLYVNGTEITDLKIPNTVNTIKDYTFNGWTNLKSVEIPNSVTSIGDGTFAKCTNLKEVHISDIAAWCNIDFNGSNANPLSIANHLYVNGMEITDLKIPNTVNKIKDYTFNGWTNLKSVEIPNSVTSIGNGAFANCTGLTSIKIPNSVTSIGYSTFYSCTGLTVVEIPNSVTSIGERAFAECTGLSSASVPNSVKTLGKDIFSDCKNLFYFKYLGRTQSTLQFKATSNISITDGKSKRPAELYVDETKVNNDGSVKLTNLAPETTHPSNLYWKCNNNQDLQNLSLIKATTLAITPTMNSTVGVTKIICTGNWSEGDAVVESYGFGIGWDNINYDNQRTLVISGLDPNTSTQKAVRFGIRNDTYGWRFETEKETFTTNSLTWETGETKATSTTSARLQVKTNCDAESGTGIEWRRIDAPDLVPSTKVACPVVDGYLVGSLRNLNPDVYYKFRPYYTSASEKTYYGEWVGLFTGDASVYFEPEVRTFDNSSVTQNSAQITGYALAGSDDINEQGFEYWKSDNQPEAVAGYATSTEGHKRIAATGIKMTAKIDDLYYGATYRYRAYVTTAKGSFYGQEYEFTTEKQSGISDVIADDEADGLTVALRENPATGTAWVKVVGTDAETVRCDIHSLNGNRLMSTLLVANGAWQPVELHVPAGVYLLTVNDSHDCKTARLIVR